MNQDLSLTLNNVNPNSWIIMAFQNLCMNSGDCTELDYNTGTMVIEVDIMDFNIFSVRPANSGLFYL